MMAAAPTHAARLTFELSDRVALDGAVELAVDGSGHLLIRRDEPDRIESWAWSASGRLSEKAESVFAPEGFNATGLASASGVTAVAATSPNAVIVLGHALAPIGEVILHRMPGAVALSPDGAKLAVAFDADAPTLVFRPWREPADDAQEAGDAPVEAVLAAPSSPECLNGHARPSDMAFDGKGHRIVAAYPGLNALATWDLETGAAGLACLGYKDWSASALDASDADHGVAIRSWPVRGAFQPTGLAVLARPNGGLVLTANQGEIDDPKDASRVARLNLDPVVFPEAASLQRDDQLGRLRVRNRGDDLDGDGDHDRLTAFGGRSLALWSWNGPLIGETGAEIETRTAQLLGARGFNAGAEANRFDARSDDMGPEPSAVAVAILKGRAYAFVTLAQTGGVIAFDVTEPDAPAYAGYARAGGEDRPWGETADLDRGPRDIAVRTEEDAIKIAVANAVSGSVTTYLARPR